MNELKPIVNEIQIDNGGSDVMLSLENMIKTNVDAIQKLTEEKKKHKEMLDDGYANNPTYREHADKAKDAAKVRNATKAEIMKQPSMAALSDKVKGFSQDIKERKNALSDYLLEYQRLTSATQLELFDGQTVEIVKTATVVKLTAFKK